MATFTIKDPRLDRRATLAEALRRFANTLVSGNVPTNSNVYYWLDIDLAEELADYLTDYARWVVCPNCHAAGAWDAENMKCRYCGVDEEPRIIQM